MMSIKSVLTLLAGSESDNAALKQAFAIAGLFDAHVEAALIEPPLGQVVYAADLYQSEGERAELAAQRRNAAQLAFVLAAREADAVIDSAAACRGPGVTASYRVENGDVSELAVPLSLFADLVVLSASEVASRGPLSDAFSEILMKVRCPVLLSARSDAVQPVGGLVLGWDGSLAAAHALAAALPLIEKKGRVQILMVQRNAGASFDTSELFEYLSLHGVEAEPRTVSSDGWTSDALALASHAGGGNLLVLGAYGHNRTVEAIFGGVTEDFIRTHSLPVLLAH